MQDFFLLEFDNTFILTLLWGTGQGVYDVEVLQCLIIPVEAMYKVFTFNNSAGKAWHAAASNTLYKGHRLTTMQSLSLHTSAHTQRGVPISVSDTPRQYEGHRLQPALWLIFASSRPPWHSDLLKGQRIKLRGQGPFIYTYQYKCVYQKHLTSQKVSPAHSGETFWSISGN